MHGDFVDRGFSVKLPFRRAEGLATKALRVDHIAFETVSGGLHGIVYFSSGPIKEILFQIGPMMIDEHFLGIERTEATWSHLVITTIYRHGSLSRQNQPHGLNDMRG